MVAPYGVAFPYTAPHGSGLLAQLNALDFWVPTDGADAGLMCNRAITAGVARYPSGFKLYLPAEWYQFTTGILIPAGFNNLWIQGDGWGTILAMAPGMTADLISNTIPAVQGNNNIQGIVVADLTIDGTAAAGTVAGQGNGVHIWGGKQCFVHHVHFKGMKNYAVIFEGSNNGGFNDVMQYCQVDSDCAGGLIVQGGNEANWLLYNELIGCAQTLAAAQPAFGTQRTTGRAFDAQNGINNIIGNVFGGGANSGTMNEALNLSNEGQRVIANRFDATMNSAINVGGSGGNGDMLFLGNEFKDSNTVVAGASVKVDASQCQFVGNIWIPDSAAHYTFCIAEDGHALANTYVYNSFRGAGTNGLVSLNAASTSRLTGNAGINPKGSLGASTPAVPASGTPLTNTTGFDVTVLISTLGGMTALAIGGTTVAPAPAAGSSYRIPAGQTVTLTWATTAPTWQWFGD